MDRKWIIRRWVIALCIVGICLYVQSAEIQDQSLMVLRKCVSQETGVAFACSPDWKLDRKGRTLHILISSSPRVELEIQESDQKIRFLNELSRDSFDDTGRYADGFEIERFRYCDRETIKVHGFLKSDPIKRVYDYYLVDHLKIHSIRFTAESSQVWKVYDRVLKQIVESVTFIDHDKRAVFLADEKEGTCQDILAIDGNKY